MAPRMGGDRDLRTTFDSVAGSYQTARPDYPDELFDDLIGVCDLRPSARLLDFGCGPGKATLPLARRGFRITALELGTSLAEVATRNLAGFPAVDVIHTSFEDWKPSPS